MKDIFTKGVTVDLRNPEFCEGVLTTHQGGVVTGPNLRLQALHIIYTKKTVDGKPVFTVEAEENVMLELGDYVYIGKRLEYDFQAGSGILYEGRTAIEPWFFGGDVIQLLSDGSYIIYNGFVTTSENYKTEWQISSDVTTLIDYKYIAAENVKFRLVQLPIFWVPSFKLNLDSIFDAPIRYTAHWGGRQGTRAGMTYELFSWN